MFILLIVNPASGQGQAARAKRELMDLVSNMPHIHAELTSGPNDAFELARGAAARGYEQVIAAGGDGTVNEVINGIGDAGLPFGIVPLGTGNVLAHHLKIPSNNISRALEVIHAGKTREVDVGTAGDRRFLLMAGLGMDAAVVNSVDRRLKDVLGTAAYAPAAMEQLVKYDATRFRLIFDGGDEYEVDAYGVIVANCSSYAHNFKIAPNAIFDDGLLDVMVFEKSSARKLRIFGHVLEAAFQKRLRDPDVSYFKTRAVRVESDPPVRMQIDGDVRGESGVDIGILPKALRLIVP